MSALLLPKHWRFNYPLLMGHLKKGAGGHLLRNTAHHLVKSCGGVCVTPATISIYSSDSCLQGFVGTWTAIAMSGSSGGCVYNGSCRSYVDSALPFSSLYRSCSALSDTFLSDTISLYCYGQNDGTIGIAATFVWKWGAGVGFSNTGFLAGLFESIDYGVSFAGFAIDSAPAGCGVPTSIDNPTAGSDLTCSVTF